MRARRGWFRLWVVVWTAGLVVLAYREGSPLPWEDLCARDDLLIDECTDRAGWARLQAASAAAERGGLLDQLALERALMDLGKESPTVRGWTAPSAYLTSLRPLASPLALWSVGFAALALAGSWVLAGFRER